MASVLAYLAAALIMGWGVAHAAPTRQVVAGFEPTTPDNKLVVTQEWLAESVAMWGLATLTITMTAVAPGSRATDWAYRVIAVVLLALAALTGATGARTPVIWFKICTVVLTTGALLLVLASIV